MATDYEKKYKEALERAKRLTSDMTTLQKIREFIFPELVESEDERIRKHLIEIVETYWGKTNEPGKAADLAWLEKQKEQKPVPLLPPFDDLIPEDKMNHPLYLEGFDIGREVQKVFDEQKPAEWSEEDEKDMAHIIRILDDCYVYGTHDLSKTDHENLVNKLKSLRPSWKPSEEQMKALLNAEGLLRKYRHIAIASKLAELYEQLKKL